MKTVIYHSADYDGIFCREIARHFLGDKDVQYLGWNFGDPRIPIPTEGKTYVLDLPLDCLQDGELSNWVIWIDHHKTSIEKWGNFVPGYRIDGVAACRLTWQWFAIKQKLPTTFHNGMLPPKEEFIDRKVSEPAAVRLAGEYDVWDKRDPNADLFQYGLRSQKAIPWDLLLEMSARGEETTHKVIADGQSSQIYAKTVDEAHMKASFLVDWEGLVFLALNGRGNSTTFASRDLSHIGHDALLMFFYNGNAWVISLYHAAHRTDLDLSAIATKYGGGGHKGACGFTSKTLPFLPENLEIDRLKAAVHQLKTTLDLFQTSKI